MKKALLTLFAVVTAAASAGAAIIPNFDGRPSGSVSFQTAIVDVPRPAQTSAYFARGSYIPEILPPGFFAPAGGAPYNRQAPLSAGDRAAEFLFITSNMERVYSHLENKQKLFGFSYEALKADYMERVRAAGSLDEYQKLVETFISTFSDPHLRVFFYAETRARAAARPIVTNTVTPDGILITRISRLFGNDDAETAQLVNGLKESLELAKTARALVVDVRGNPGGNDGYSRDYISRLVAQPIPTGQVTIKISSETLAREEDGYLPEDPARPGWTPWRETGVPSLTKEPFKGPIALLIDGGCVSSCEGTAVMFKFSGVAKLYGATTMGSSGYPARIDLPGNRGRIHIPTWIRIMPDGNPIEDHGIEPDVPTAPREALDRALADIRAGFN